MKCLICNSTRVKELLAMPLSPLSVLDLPSVPDTGRARYSFKLCFCEACGHAFNSMYNPQFDQTAFGGCTMYNSGQEWQDHMEDVASLVLRKEDGPIVEVGAGNCEFARLVTPDTPSKYIAYEPAAEDSMYLACPRNDNYLYGPEKGDDLFPYIDLRNQYFTADELRKVKPSVIVMRHVLEHIYDARAYLESLYAASQEVGKEVTLVIEVPSAEIALEKGRLEDWVYEHPHHFTSYSLGKLLRLSGWSADINIEHLYGYEVLLATSTLPKPSPPETFTTGFDSVDALKETKASLKGRVVFWGGAGKSANLINILDPCTCEVLVVDSDYRKWGYYVPGTHYKINDPHVLTSMPKGDIIVTTTWRTEDIVKEIHEKKIPYGRILNLVGGVLKEYNGQ